MKLIFEDKTELEIDCVNSLAPTYNSEKTNNEIEEGAEITDHVIRQPVNVTISGFVSNVPLKVQGDVGLGVAYDKKADGPHLKFHDRITKAWQNAELVTLDAGVLGRWEEYLITSYTPNWTTDTGYGVNFSLSLEDLQVVQTRTTINVLKALKRGSEVAAAVTDRFAQKVLKTWTQKKTADTPTANLAATKATYTGASTGFVRGR